MPAKQNLYEQKTAFAGMVELSDGCWHWKGATKGNGYGHTSRGTAHRRSFFLFVGPIPEKMDVCHKCDNPICVKPSHLFVGTRGENMADCKAKGRIAKGAALGDRKAENGPASKLKWDDVRTIRNSPLKSKMLAQMFGVSSDNINKIRKNVTWKVEI